MCVPPPPPSCLARRGEEEVRRSGADTALLCLPSLSSTASLYWILLAQRTYRIIAFFH